MGERANLKTWLVISALLVITGIPAVAAEAIIYVDASKNGDGSSWANACKYLQDALSAAASGDEIWVAEGIYVPDRSLANPDGSGDRFAAFQLKTGVGIYGGFPIGGGSWDDRDINSHETILNGDLNGNDVGFANNADNSYHVARALDTDSTAVLNGFTITAGNADGSGMEGDGGGMSNYRSSATITHCTFKANFTKKRGGAIANKQCNLTVANCIFSSNYADNAGGAIFNQNSDPLLINCTFIDNSASIYGGGIHNCSASNETVANCTFTGNSAGSYGGGISNDYSSSTVVNCILWDNTAQDGSQISLQSGSSLIISYCCLQGFLQAIYDDGTSSVLWGLGNIADNPGFKSDSYHLQSGSPCIDAGDPDCDYTGQVDIDGEPRVMGQHVDIGSDEVFILLYYVDDDAPGDPEPGNPDISDPFENGSPLHPFDSIQEAIDATPDEATIDVLDGTYTGYGNRDIDFYGKAITLRSLNGAADCIIDCQGAGRGFDFHSGETQRTIVAGFTITNGQADFGGAVRCVSSNPQITNCVISNNKPDGIWTQGDGAWIVGNTQIISNDLTGNGAVQMKPDTIIDMHDSHIFCNLSGPGTVKANIHTELIIGGDAVVDLNNPDDPNANGVIECDGPLQVVDDVQILNANISVILASIEDNADISNCRITVRPPAPYGQFFIEPNVDVTFCDFFSDGNRYVNMDPSTYVGQFQNNRIFVTITEGVGQTRGGLFEARGQDDMVSHGCEPGEFLCQVTPGTIPPCSPTTWTVERFEVNEYAKVNLVNRRNFQPPYGFAGEDEVLYVKELVLRANSVFNTGFNRVYYETLTIEPNASTRDEPLIGFSLINITFDDELEYLIRIKHNNYEDPADPSNDRIHVERVVGSAPDPNGMMRMCNLLDQSTGQVVNARAKGLFANAEEDEILIRFEYLFGTSNPSLRMAELVVSLSDDPKLPEHDDPSHIDHCLEVARLFLPPEGQYGSVGSGHFGVFEKTVSRGDLDFIRGVRMELELVGPEGTWILINNWDPFVSCIYCGDVTGDFGITPRDYLTVLGEFGSLSSDTSELGSPLHCLDFGFSDDGFVSAPDLMGWDWEEWGVSEGMIGNLCIDLCLACGAGGSASSSSPMAPASSTSVDANSLPTTLADFEGPLLVAGKRFDSSVPDFLSDRLYGFNRDPNLIAGPFTADNDRANGKLVRDQDGQLYQINLDEGLVRLDDGVSVIPRGQSFSVGSEPRYGQSATIYIGFQGQGENTWGRPILDAAFDSDGDVYVTPVVVVPDGGNAYVASTKLEVIPNETPPYHVVEIYDDSPLPAGNQDLSNLSEIEVDDGGDVYVININYMNNSDTLWAYRSDGGVSKRALQDMGIYGPVGLCCSSYDYSRLYVASSLNEPDASSASVYVLSTEDLTLLRIIDVNDIGHITDITEDPVSGTVWVTGFTMPEYMTTLPGNLSQTPRFYHPYIAAIPYDSLGSVQATPLLNASDLALPLSIIWTGATQGNCGGANLGGTDGVNLVDFSILSSQWQQPPGTPSADIAPESLKDGVVNILDLVVLVSNWLESDCSDL